MVKYTTFIYIYTILELIWRERERQRDDDVDLYPLAFHSARKFEALLSEALDPTRPKALKNPVPARDPRTLKDSWIPKKRWQYVEGNFSDIMFDDGLLYILIPFFASCNIVGAIHLVFSDLLCEIFCWLHCWMCRGATWMKHANWPVSSRFGGFGVFKWPSLFG